MDVADTQKLKILNVDLVKGYNYKFKKIHVLQKSILISGTSAQINILPNIPEKCYNFSKINVGTTHKTI